jgi:hypothetical protein
MAEASLKELLATSSLAFSGTVRSLGESPVAGVEADERTAVVQVDAALHAPEELDLAPGDAVTVQLSPDQPALQPGERATFFTVPVVYADTLVVAEVGRMAAEAITTARVGSPEAPASPVEDALAEIDQDAIREHALDADAVVRGHVIALQAVDPRETLHEHHPHWWIATLLVDLVQRGDVPDVGEEGGEVRVVYANSLDIRWRRWPKPKAGQSGMWILHRTADELAELAPFQLTHPEDLQPSLQLELLRDNGTGGAR